jgi:hypothetical protein
MTIVSMARGWCALALLVLSSGCPLTSGPASSKNPPGDEGSAVTTAVTPDGGPARDSSDCNCIAFPAAGADSCPASDLFCNSQGLCNCDAAAAAAAPGQAPAVSPRRKDDHCSCAGGSASPPQGGCAAQDWFCNRSGVCRCAR